MRVHMHVAATPRKPAARPAHHLGAVPDEHLHQLRPSQLQEGGVGLRRARARDERLAGARGAVQQDALWGADAQLDEALLEVCVCVCVCVGVCVCVV